MSAFEKIAEALAEAGPSLDDIPDGWMRDIDYARELGVLPRRARELLIQLHRRDPEKHPRKQFLVQCDSVMRRVFYTKVY